MYRQGCGSLIIVFDTEMEQFYRDMESRAAAVQLEQDKQVTDLWKAAVEKGAERGTPVRNIRCKLKFRPRREVLDKLQTNDIKLAAAYYRPTSTVDEFGRTTQVCGYYEVYVRDTGWFSSFEDYSRK